MILSKVKAIKALQVVKSHNYGGTLNGKKLGKKVLCINKERESPLLLKYHSTTLKYYGIYDSKIKEYAPTGIEREFHNHINEHSKYGGSDYSNDLDLVKRIERLGPDFFKPKQSNEFRGSNISPKTYSLIKGPIERIGRVLQSKLVEENYRKERFWRLCKLCLERRWDIVLLECGHALCSVCKLVSTTCPFCRADIADTIDTNLIGLPNYTPARARGTVDNGGPSAVLVVNSIEPLVESLARGLSSRISPSIWMLVRKVEYLAGN